LTFQDEASVAIVSMAMAETEATLPGFLSLGFCPTLSQNLFPAGVPPMIPGHPEAPSA
jgi:hypothetical protein